MPPVLPAAKPAGPVMSQRWGRRSTLDGELSHATTAYSFSDIYQLLPHGTATLSTQLELSTQFSHTTRFKSAAFIQRVKHLQCRHAFLLLIALALILPPVTSLPFIDEHPDHVIFRYQICQPVSVTNMRLIMGQHLDEDNMAMDLTSAQRILRSAAQMDNSPGCQGEDEAECQQDTPHDDVQYEDDSVDSREDESWKSLSESGDVRRHKNRVSEREQSEELVERRSWVPRRKILHNRDAKNRSSNNSSYDTNNSDISESISNSNSNPFVRHRPRRSSGPGRTYLDQEKKADENINTADTFVNDRFSNKKASANSLIPLEMLANEHNKKKFQSLTRRLKQNAKSLARSSPWDCQVVKRIRKMNAGVFPAFVVDGRCATDKCFYNLAPCEPIKAAVKLLQRDPNRCNPLPSTSNSSVYEERWELITKYITLDCKCGRILSPILANSRKKD